VIDALRLMIFERALAEDEIARYVDRLGETAIPQ
jgi:hypothetical protein